MGVKITQCTFKHLNKQYMTIRAVRDTALLLLQQLKTKITLYEDLKSV